MMGRSMMQPSLSTLVVVVVVAAMTAFAPASAPAPAGTDDESPSTALCAYISDPVPAVEEMMTVALKKASKRFPDFVKYPQHSK